MTAGEAKRGADIRELFASEPLRTICAWCQPPRITKPGRLPATHGICSDCSANVLQRKDRSA